MLYLRTLYTPSLTDTFCIVLIEALACGTPIAGFDVTGPKDIVIEGVNGSLDDEKLELRMNVCPSLSKVLDNDAEPMKRYCDHCAGWIGPLIDKVDHHLVYDVIDRNKPQCVVKIFKDKEKAIEEEKNAKLLMGWPKKKK